jgi:hypothetical protein
MLPEEKPFKGSFSESFRGKRKDLGFQFKNSSVIKPDFSETSFYETLRLKHVRGKFHTGS